MPPASVGAVADYSVPFVSCRPRSKPFVRDEPMLVLGTRPSTAAARAMLGFGEWCHSRVRAPMLPVCGSPPLSADDVLFLHAPLVPRVIASTMPTGPGPVPCTLLSLCMHREYDAT